MFKQLRLWQKISLSLLLAIVLLIAITLLARVPILNTVVNHYLPEGSRASIGLWPISRKGLGLHEIYLKIPKVVELKIGRFFIGYPSLVDEGYGLSSLSVDDLSINLPQAEDEQLTIKTHRLRLENLILHMLDVPVAENQQTISDTTIAADDENPEALSKDMPEDSTLYYALSLKQLRLQAVTLQQTSSDSSVALALDEIRLHKLYTDLSTMSEQQSVPLVTLDLLSLTGSDIDLQENQQPALELLFQQLEISGIDIQSEQQVKINRLTLQAVNATEYNIARQFGFSSLSLNDIAWLSDSPQKASEPKNSKAETDKMSDSDKDIARAASTAIAASTETTASTESTEQDVQNKQALTMAKEAQESPKKSSQPDTLASSPQSEASEQRLSFSKLTIDEISHNYREGHPFLKPEQPLFTQQQFEVESFELQDFNKLSVALVALHDSQLNVALNKQGQLNLSDFDSGNQNPNAKPVDKEKMKSQIWVFLRGLISRKKTENAASKAQEKAAAFVFDIEAIKLLEGFNIHVQDLSQSKPVNIEAEITQLDLNKIQNVDSKTRSSLLFAASIAPKGTINADADFNLLNTDNFAINSKVSHVELPALSPYAEAAIGYSLDSGRLNTVINTTSRNAQLAGDVNIKLNKLTLTLKDKDKAEKHSKSLNMPIATAVNTLKDKHGNIELNTTIEGSLDDPDFSVGKLATIIMAKVAKQQTAKLLSLAVSPVGWVSSSMFGKSPYKQLTSLPAIEYDKGEYELDDKDEELINNLAKLLEQQPEFSFKLCAVVNKKEADTEAGRTKLAQKRVKEVEEALNNANVDATRWMSCRAEINDEDDVSIVYFSSK